MKFEQWNEGGKADVGVTGVTYEELSPVLSPVLLMLCESSLLMALETGLDIERRCVRFERWGLSQSRVLLEASFPLSQSASALVSVLTEDDLQHTLRRRQKGV